MHKFICRCFRSGNAHGSYMLNVELTRHSNYLHAEFVSVAFLYLRKFVREKKCRFLYDQKRCYCYQMLMVGNLVSVIIYLSPSEKVQLFPAIIYLFS